MKIIKETLSNGNIISYIQLDSGTCYHLNTPADVIKQLECARLDRYRIRCYYGDTVTGQDWNEEYDTIGYIGRSTGSIRIPLLIHNLRSSGGGALLDHCIIKITKKHQVLYQHHLYHLLPITVLYERVFKAGKLFASFKTPEQASKYFRFITGLSDKK